MEFRTDSRSKVSCNRASFFAKGGMQRWLLVRDERKEMNEKEERMLQRENEIRRNWQWKHWNKRKKTVDFSPLRTRSTNFALFFTISTIYGVTTTTFCHCRRQIWRVRINLGSIIGPRWVGGVAVISTSWIFAGTPTEKLPERRKRERLMYFHYTVLSTVNSFCIYT